jgi:hypothetical protein
LSNKGYSIRNVKKVEFFVKRYLKNICFCGLSLWLVTIALPVEAKVTVLGFHIGQKWSYEKLKKSFVGVTDVGLNEYTGMPMYDIEPSQFHLMGLHKVTLVFGRAQDLAGVFLTLKNTPENFYLFYGILKERYKLLSKKTPFLGSMYAHYETKNVFVYLDAHYLDTEMQLNYIRGDLLQRMKAKHPKSLWQRLKNFFSKLFKSN